MDDTVRFERRSLGEEGELYNREAEALVEAEELAILCIDVSQSMGQPVDPSNPGVVKSEDVARHICDEDGMLYRLATGSNRRSYHVGVVLFDHGIRISRPQPLVEEEIAPTEYYHVIPRAAFFKHNGRTNIGQALTHATEMALEWLGNPSERQRDGLPPRVATILLFSDGDDTEGSDPEAVARHIRDSKLPTLPPSVRKSLGGRPAITFATVAYGQQANVKMLRGIATSSEYFTTVRSGKGDELRDFFLRSLFNHT